MRDFKKYDVWKLSHQFTLKLYKVIEKFPSTEIYGISSQIKRASVSIPTNIFEGCGRSSDAEFNRFLTISLGSACETEYLLLLSKDLKFLSIDLYEELNNEINLIKKKIYSLKQKLK